MDASEVVPPAGRFAPRPGSPEPLGASLTPEGTNFAVFSRHATGVSLALFAPGGSPRGEIALRPERHRTGDVWHVFVPGVRAGAEYGWHADSTVRGPGHAFEPDALLLDPYAKGVAGSERWGKRSLGGRGLRGVVCDLAYDWGDDLAPRTPLERTLIFETHVRAFTRHPSSGVRHPGTFAGFAEKIPELRDLGVTAVQLMPVAEFDETDNPHTNPHTGERLLNVWGYSPLAFMAPKLSYASVPDAASALREFRELVRALHAAGIEVLLDVVYNHTGEPGRRAVPRSWRGLDRASYFLLDAAGRDVDFTGCGHTFACANPPAADMILDALRFWARDMHVDGFRFDLAATLTRGPDGHPLEDPPLLRRIASDPALAHCKLVAEPWDTGLYLVGRFPHHGRFAELNGRFRDDVRDWLRGAARGPGALAARLSGSADLFAPARGPGHSVNFLTSHDGFTLADLVSHERKHNAANGENSRDGTDDHRSWNGGAEGSTRDPVVCRTRERQARNAAALLLLARGARLWLWGDERLRTQHGNNNAWCQDGPDWWLDWSDPAAARAFRRFVRGLISLRRESVAWPGTGGLAPPGADAAGVEWLAPDLSTPPRDEGGARLVGRFPGGDGADLLLLVNGDPEPCEFRLPAPPGEVWRRVVDTAALPPEDFSPPASARSLPGSASLHLEGRSLQVLVADGRRRAGSA